MKKCGEGREGLTGMGSASRIQRRRNPSSFLRLCIARILACIGSSLTRYQATVAGAR